MAVQGAEVRRLNRPEGQIAYEVAGEGPLVVLIPGMGDLRATYRRLVPALVAAGYRTATMDLRGHGDSDTTFGTFGDAVTGDDALALIAELGGPAVVIGNSMGGGAAVWAAAEQPKQISGLVLLAPFVRDAKTTAVQRLVLRIAMVPLWAATTWKAYLPTLNAGRRPDDFEAYRSAVIASLKRPGRVRAFVQTTRISHAEATVRLGDVSTPTLVVMGELDPDFPTPAEEAAWIAEQLKGEVVMVPEAGHYPQSQRPDVVNPAVIEFLARSGAGA